MNIDTYKKYYKFIKRNRTRFYRLIRTIDKTKDQEKRLKLAQKALSFLNQNSCAIYASPFLEKIFTDLAHELPVEIGHIEYKPKSFLHVMSEAYSFGGHTRVVERWISQSSNDENHNVVLLKQIKNTESTKNNHDAPTSLYQSLETKGGQLYNLSKIESLQEKAVKLRLLASEYEYIILHIHMDDPTALVAFGTNAFKRPIIFYNHADHAFWCGVTIADMVAELNEIGHKRSLNKRGVTHSKILGIPLEDNFLPEYDKVSIRKRLNIPKSQKMIFMSGSARKFATLEKNELVECLSIILSRHLDVLCYAIGPDIKDKAWKRLVKRFGERIHILPNIGYKEGYFDYICAADIIIDSHPINGGTAMIDACLAKKPILSIKGVLGQSDYLIDSQSFCRNKDELIEKTEKILTDKIYANEIATDTQCKMLEKHSPENWGKLKKAIIEATPKQHRLYNFPEKFEQPIISDEDVFIGLWHSGANAFTPSYQRFIFRLARSIRKRLPFLKVTDVHPENRSI